MEPTRTLTVALILIFCTTSDGTAQSGATLLRNDIRPAPDGQALDGPGFVRLRVANAADTQSDEALIVFTSGTPATDDEDVPKFSFVHPTAPRIATLGDGSVMLAINAYGPFTTSISIPVMLKVASDGMYTVTVTGLSALGYSCFSLEDPAGNMFPLSEGSALDFSALAAADPSIPRFQLHASDPLLLTANSPTCSGDTDGSVELELPEGPADVQWFGAGGQLLAEIGGVPVGTTGLSGLASGEYTAEATGISACGSLKIEFELVDPAPLEGQPELSMTSCPSSEDGMVELNMTGGTEPYNYLWSNSSSSSDLTTGSGMYSAEVTDANGCVWTGSGFIIEAGSGPVAFPVVEGSDHLVGDGIVFNSDNDPELDHFWDLGDGTSSTDPELEHAYDLPGTYTVSLTISDGNCDHTASVVVPVESHTGLSEASTGSFKAWYSNEQVLIESGIHSSGPLTVRLLDLSGKLLHEVRVTDPGVRLSVAAANIPSGTCLVQVLDDQHKAASLLSIVR